MNITIYTHSQTGNSLSVANMLMEAIHASGNSADLSLIVPDDINQTELSKVRIQPISDASSADLIIVGGPVHGFSATPAVIKAISTMEHIEGKNAVLYVTQHLPYNWMGGSQAIRQIEKALSAKGASVVCKGDIHWNRKDRQKQIEDFTEDFRLVLSGKSIH